MNQAKFIFLVISVFFVSQSCFGQKRDAIDFKEDGIIITHRMVECDNASGYDEKVKLISIQNTTDEPINVTWTQGFWINQECRTCDNAEEHQASHTVVGGQTISGSCDKTDGYRNLRITLDLLGYEEKNPITDHKMLHITLTKPE